MQRDRAERRRRGHHGRLSRHRFRRGRRAGEDRRFAYVSSGTWSLAGLELDKPVLTAASRQANFTNEGGVDGRIRFLRNVGGLWLLQESMRTWTDADMDHDLGSLLAAAESLPAGGPIIDVDDAALIAPGRHARTASPRPSPEWRSSPSGPAATVRCILDSLATAYARTLTQASPSPNDVDVVHVVGGGSQNQLLCQLPPTCPASQSPVDPVEATALGNVLIQARAHGAARRFARADPGRPRRDAGSPVLCALVMPALPPTRAGQLGQRSRYRPWTDRGRHGPVSIKDVAAAGRSIVGTVSNVLNRPATVRPTTRAKVEAAIAQLGFVPNASARQPQRDEAGPWPTSSSTRPTRSSPT